MELRSGRGSGDGVPRSWSIFNNTQPEIYQNQHSNINRPCENERHNLMPLMAFIIAVSCCTIFGILGVWPPCPLRNPPLIPYRMPDLGIFRNNADERTTVCFEYSVRVGGMGFNECLLRLAIKNHGYTSGSVCVSVRRLNLPSTGHRALG